MVTERTLETLRAEVRHHLCTDESTVVYKLMGEVGLDKNARERMTREAGALVAELREDSSPGLMEVFLAEYGLSTREGVALMCLSEALLRVPDETSIDALIRDKVASADWGRHIGHASSPLVNASTWGLMLTGKVIGPGGNTDWDMEEILHGLIRRVGEPIIRAAVTQAMTILGHQFVLGRDIHEAMKRAVSNEEKGYAYSYDMLGEAAHTAADAQRYLLSYSQAISALAERSADGEIRDRPEISVKISALHPRYEFAQHARVMDELAPRLASLVHLAKNAGIRLCIDAEEANRLDISLDVIEAVFSSNELKEWDGFGVAVQTYSPRAPYVLDWLHGLARKFTRRIMVRLVKGAYWDSEIKVSQIMGLGHFPVFTRKSSTDVSYLACAHRLFEMSDRVYPQFSTHSAATAAAIIEMAGDRDNFEFQRLHGMGEALHALLRERYGKRCRIYAPVGVHRDLLAYLVRRLLENGANSSFVNQVLDKSVPVARIVRDPIDILEKLDVIANPRIPLPADIYPSGRRNSRGWDLADPPTIDDLEQRRAPYRTATWHAAPVIAGVVRTGTSRLIINPADRRDEVGAVVDAGSDLAGEALGVAMKAAGSWRDRPVEERARIVANIADLYEENAVELMALAAREAGKTLPDSVAELREAVDYCRYYAEQARIFLADGSRQGRGVFVCISPWNFPLAIFTGQVVAALVVGNAVVAKPAGQTPLMAARAVALMHAAGVPREALNLLPGEGATVGRALVADPRIGGVCFTGSTGTAQSIHLAMAVAGNARAPLIAETGGLNAMIVDSTALPEQAVRDIISSAFQSAGQRCSSLRLLCVQEDIADTILEILKGAMDELAIGNPWEIATDIGPIIGEGARAGIENYCRAREADGCLIHKVALPALAGRGAFVAPVAYRLGRVSDLEREVFGPVLHVVTFKAEDLDTLVDEINATGYGLTLGLHTRIDQRVQEVARRARVGNLYVNRNQIGAVVGVQPFGGEGLSGTGPKAGGPHYLARFTISVSDTASTTTVNIGPEPARRKCSAAQLTRAVEKSREAQPDWDACNDRGNIMLAAAAQCPEVEDAVRHAVAAVRKLDFGPVTLPGPTGETNRFRLHGRGIFLCLGCPGEGVRLVAQQVAMALAAGNGVVVTKDLESYDHALRAAGAPEGILRVVEGNISPDMISRVGGISGVVADGSPQFLIAVRRALAVREGPILQLVTDPEDLTVYVLERMLCVDTTAAGGNASLLAAVGDTD